MENKISTFKLNLLTGMSFILILIPVLFFVLWNYCFRSQSNHADRVKMYDSYFPEFLQGGSTISYTALALSFLGVTLAFMYFKRRNPYSKIIHLVVIIAGILTIMLYLFSLM